MQNSLENNFNINSTTVAIISNFIGESIDYAISNDAREIVLCGDLGKLIKLSGGIMNTHSNDSDSRLELLVAAVIKLCIKEKKNYRFKLFQIYLNKRPQQVP